ncbi:6131_t:CDS:2 [Acaulospora colombiana]|uniref:6131_t:CDS:1 n=1 Tax=Acaulospora colombiana TaxID=27376 RepID=A0ACA9L2T9_9GLOM|nr:6131_t:CDS:2 [Acaulospora colombiana]
MADIVIVDYIVGIMVREVTGSILDGYLHVRWPKLKKSINPPKRQAERDLSEKVLAHIQKRFEEVPLAPKLSGQDWEESLQDQVELFIGGGG